KGAAAFTGAGFVTLAATLTVVPDVPIQALAILIGIDKFMSECRALTNLVGNGVAAVVISRLEGELDDVRFHTPRRDPNAPAPTSSLTVTSRFSVNRPVEGSTPTGLAGKPGGL